MSLVIKDKIAAHGEVQPLWEVFQPRTNRPRRTLINKQLAWN